MGKLRGYQYDYVSFDSQCLQRPARQGDALLQPGNHPWWRCELEGVDHEELPPRDDVGRLPDLLEPAAGEWTDDQRLMPQAKRRCSHGGPRRVVQLSLPQIVDGGAPLYCQRPLEHSFRTHFTREVHGGNSRRGRPNRHTQGEGGLSASHVSAQNDQVLPAHPAANHAVE
jgi:hypothetical protein